ncbi:MAG TPA: DUF2092 domain-containing protein [Planctomycetaceae bacterium]|jgi:hypothetical protein|nr:DUF2092 domain-containing protein [Planctomycetaceae bacterium]
MDLLLLLAIYGAITGIIAWGSSLATPPLREKTILCPRLYLLRDLAMSDDERAVDKRGYAERPKRLAVRANWEDAQLGLVCDGRSLSTWVGPSESPKPDSNPANVYWQSDAPPSLAELAESWRFMESKGWPRPAVLQLLADDPYEDLMEGVTAASYIGEEKLDGKRVHRVKFVRDAVIREAWIASEGTPVLEKMVIDIPEGLFFTLCSHSEKVSLTITQSSSISCSACRISCGLSSLRTAWHSQRCGSACGHSTDALAPRVKSASRPRPRTYFQADPHPE